jgi:hypothetical protein
MTTTKHYWKTFYLKGYQIAKTVFKKNKVADLRHPDFKPYYKALAIKKRQVYRPMEETAQKQTHMVKCIFTNSAKTIP